MSTFLLIAAAGKATAQTKTWVGNGAQAYNQGIWGGNANWTPSGPANGADNTAYFTNTFNNGYACLVNTARTIGHIWFTDPPNLTDFTLLRHASDFTLTLAVSSNSPVINVTQVERTLVIDTVTAGTSGLAKNGAGTLIFTRPNTYTGTTVVNAGTLKSRTGSTTTGFAVAGGATSIVVLDPGFPQLVIAGGWTNASNSALGIDYAGNTPSTTVPPIQVAILSLGSNLTCRISADLFTTLPAGQSYPLITWTVSGPADATAFTNLVLAANVTGNLSVSGNTLYLNITANNWGPLSWNTGNGNWDTTTANWVNASLLPAIYNNNPADSVLIGDATGAAGNPIITLSTVLSPTGVTMNSTNHDYTLSGVGGIGGVNGLTLGVGNLRNLTLSATTNHTFKGGTTINGGKLRLGAANVIPDGAGYGTVTVNSNGILDLNGFSEAINNLVGNGVVDNAGGGSATLTVGGDNSTTVFSGVFQNSSGTLNLAKNGTGSLSLSGANTCTGTVTINAGTLSFDNPIALSTVTNITLAGGTILNPAANNSVINGTITLGASGTAPVIYGPRGGSGVGAVFTLTLNGPITGGTATNGVIFKSANQNATAPTIILNAPSTYAGSTLITCDANASAGLNCYVQLGTNNGLPSTTVLTFDGLDNSANRYVQLELNGFNQTLAGLTNVPLNRQQVVGNAGGTPSTLTLNTASNYTFSGVISGYTAVTKNGAAKQVLAGVNSYTEATTINNGILEIGGAGQLGAGSYYGNITIAGGAALNFTGTNIMTLGGTISGGGSLTNAGTGILTISGSVSLPNTTVVSGSTLAIAGGSVNAVTVTSNGTLNLPLGGTATNIVFSGAAVMNFDLTSGGALTVVANNGVANSGPAGSLTINITGPTPSPGTYKLVAYNGSLQGSGFSAYKLGATPGSAKYTLVNSPGAVQLVVEAPLIWTGAQSSEWSINPIGGLQNWTLSSTPTDYANGMAVLFDDSLQSPFNSVADISVANVTPDNATFNNWSYNYTLQGSGAIAGAAYLVKNGSASLTVLNNNTYSGGTTIAAGQVQIGNGGSSGALGPGAIANHGDLQFNRSDVLTVPGSISGSGTLQQNGSGTLTLSGANTYTNATSVNNGTLNLTGTNSGSSVMVMNSGAFTETSSGVISGTGVTFTHNSTGASSLAGANRFTGAINVNAGQLTLSNWATNTLGTLTVAGSPEATLGLSGTATYNLGANSLFVASAAGLGGTVNQSGGTLTFNSGNAVLLGNGAGSGSSGTYNLSGGTLTTGFTNTTRGVIIGVNSSCSGNFNLSGTANLGLTNASLQVARSDAAAGNSVSTFNQTGGTATVGTLTIGGNGTTSGTNTANLNLTAGTFLATSFTRLALGNDDVVGIKIGGAAQVTLPAFPTARGSNAVVTITFDSTTGFLSPGAASTAYMRDGTFANAYLTTNGANFNVASGRDITIGQLLQNAPSQSGTLQKSGTGVLTLTNANTYSGNTTVTAGTLRMNNSAGSGTGTGTVTVSSGGTLGGTGTIGGAVVVNGTLSAGTSVGTLNTGSQTWNGGATNRFELSSATNSAGWDFLNVAGALDVQATSGSKFTVKLASMANATTAGVMTDFSNNGAYTWIVATASSGISNFDGSKFRIDTSSFSNAFTGTFSIAQQGNSLVVRYVPLTPPVLSTFGPLSGTSFPMTFSGPSGQSYKVLTSTNVAAPLANWAALTSGSFGASPVTYTDTSATNAQQFYRIQSP